MTLSLTNLVGQRPDAVGSNLTAVINQPEGQLMGRAQLMGCRNAESSCATSACRARLSRGALALLRQWCATTPDSLYHLCIPVIMDEGSSMSVHSPCAESNGGTGGAASHIPAAGASFGF